MNTTTTVTTVGFVGLGDQGAPMARAVAESPFDLRVWARRPASLDSLNGSPHTVEPSLSALGAASDIVLLVLRDDSDVEGMLSDGRLLPAMRQGSILVNHGTGDPANAQRFAELAADRNVAFLDAPVSGGGPGAEARSLTTIVGGDRDAFAVAEAVFDTFSTSVVFMGSPGAGQQAKLLNNALTMTNLKNVADVFAIADRTGVDITALQRLLATSSGGSFVSQALGQSITSSIAPHLHTLMRKDIEHFADAIGRMGVDVSDLRDRGLAGAEELEAVTALVELSKDATLSRTDHPEKST